MLENVVWFGHASVLIKTKFRTVYIDPWKIPDKSPVATLILITHEHYDHLSVRDIKKISDKNTKIVAAQCCKSKLGGFPVRLVFPGEELVVAGVSLSVVSSYNLDKGFHRKENSGVGFVADIAGLKYYHPGDCDFIPEMESVVCDIAFMPCGGTYTMTGWEAAQAANSFNPKVVVPIHWGDIVGTKEDAWELAEHFDGETVILDCAVAKSGY